MPWEGDGRSAGHQMRGSLRHSWRPLKGGCLVNFVDADFYFKMTDAHFIVLFIIYFTTRKRTQYYLIHLHLLLNLAQK